MILEATFTSVWDDEIEISTPCKVDTDSKKVFDIQMADASDLSLNVCTDEYLTFQDGEIHSVSENDSDTEYHWSD